VTGWGVSAAGLIQDGFYQLCRLMVSPPVMGLTGVRHYNVPRPQLLAGGLLIAANHQSYLDPVLVGMALSRPICYLARSSLFEVPGLGLLIRGLKTHPVRRGTVDARALRTTIRLLRSGETLLMFPEGTRSQNGSMGRFQPGVAAIALRCGVPLLPVCVEGAYRCWPRWRALPRPARAAVAYGEPIRPRGEPEELIAAVRAQIEALRPVLRRRLGREVETETSGRKAVQR
jgi:1-acyl-sn-glycerol-3-phosphate acyltransferase